MGDKMEKKSLWEAQPYMAEPFSYVDPLYEMGVFRTRKKQSIFEFLLGETQPPEKLISRLIDTYEMNRLNYLKQSGLLFLIFPSSTHTRFAHSIGTMNLGLYAMERIRVKGLHGIETLEDYLSRNGLMEEFLVALLLHDIGHMPFSHTLEGANKVKEKYGDHECITLNLLDENSSIYKRLKKYADEKGSETAVSVCKDYGEVDISVVIGLLSGEINDPIKELISGHLDIDRLDHCYRDSFFIGLKFATINIVGFLNSLVLEVEPNNPRIVVREDGVQHILHLLFAREMLFQKAFDNDFNCAYNAMLTYAVEKWLDENPEEIDNLPFITEETLLAKLTTCKVTQKMIDRIFNRKPYYLLYKGETTLKEEQVSERFHEWKARNAWEEDDFILYLPADFQQYTRASKEWLARNTPVLVGRKTVVLGNFHSDLFDYFAKQAAKRMRTIRVFSKKKLDNNKREKLEEALT